jgi:thymidylate kinase
MPDEPVGHPSSLVLDLLRALAADDISYCQWKSTIDLARATSGQSDLDLLVSRADQPALLELLGRLGFREADPPPEKAAAGTRSFFGYDPAAPRLIHAHVHYLLMVGHDLSKGFRLPLEQEFLGSARRSGHFQVPAPELELVAYVVRMVLKRGTLDSILRGRGRLTKREARELAWLESEADPDQVRQLLNDRDAVVDFQTFSRCRESLRPESAPRMLWQCGRDVRDRLAGRSPRSPQSDAGLRLARIVRYRARKASRGKAPRHTPVGGGLVVALVGSDGSGKSTALQAIEDWLAPDLDVLRAHLGRPPWSRTTVFVRGGLKAGRMAGRPFRGPALLASRSGPTSAGSSAPTLTELARFACTARDRNLVYRDITTAAARGRIVLCDRYPLAGLMRMDGPQVGRLLEGTRAGPLARFIRRREEHYYEPFVAPDLLFVLQIDEDVARNRKPEDDPERVTRRSREILGIDWSGTGAIVLDASRPAAEIAAEIKQRIWREI